MLKQNMLNFIKVIFFFNKKMQKWPNALRLVIRVYLSKFAENWHEFNFVGSNAVFLANYFKVIVKIH